MPECNCAEHPSAPCAPGATLLPWCLLPIETRASILQVAEALKASFIIAEELITQAGVDLELSGTTLSVAYMEQNHLFIATCGDSRVVLASQGPSGGLVATALSNDHRLTRASEKARCASALKHTGRRLAR